MWNKKSRSHWKYWSKIKSWPTLYYFHSQHDLLTTVPTKPRQPSKYLPRTKWTTKFTSAPPCLSWLVNIDWTSDRRLGSYAMRKPQCEYQIYDHVEYWPEIIFNRTLYNSHTQGGVLHRGSWPLIDLQCYVVPQYESQTISSNIDQNLYSLHLIWTPYPGWSPPLPFWPLLSSLCRYNRQF